MSHSICIASGKGGVGKTTITANLAQALANLGYRILLVDADLGMSNLDVVFRVEPEYSMMDILQGDKNTSEIVTPINSKIDLLAGGSALIETQKLSFGERQSIQDSIKEISSRYDFVLVDSASGIGDNVLYFGAQADEIVLVITPDPASFTDGYAALKVFHQIYKCDQFSLVMNKVRNYDEGLRLFERFEAATYQFLSVSLSLRAVVPNCELYRTYTQHRRLITESTQTSPAKTAIEAVANKMGQEQKLNNWNESIYGENNGIINC